MKSIHALKKSSYIFMMKTLDINNDSCNITSCDYASKDHIMKLELALSNPIILDFVRHAKMALTLDAKIVDDHVIIYIDGIRYASVSHDAIMTGKEANYTILIIKSVDDCSEQRGKMMIKNLILDALE